MLRVVRGICVGLPLIQMSPSLSGVSECDRKTSIMRGPWPTRECLAMEKETSSEPLRCYRSSLNKELKIDD